MPESAMCLIHDLIKPPNHIKLYEFKNCDGPLKTFYNLWVTLHLLYMQT